MNKITFDDLLAVVVLYRKSPEASTTLVSLNASVAVGQGALNVLVYDNSPKACEIDAFSELKSLHVKYIHDRSNPGVSKAYNTGAAMALETGQTYLLFLDQDTALPKHSIKVYLDAVNSACERVKLFCPILMTRAEISYSPAKYYFRRGWLWNNIVPGVYSLKNKSALNSGLLVNTEAYHAAGGYDERIKLYFSDFDFINRFRDLYDKMMVVDLVCIHSLADVELVDHKAAANRFSYYAEGSYYSSHSISDYFFHFMTVFLRALKLSIRYKTLHFATIFFRQFFFGKSTAHSA